MGFTTATTHMIFFIAGCIIASTLVGVFKLTIDSTIHSMNERQKILTTKLQTAIDIINDPNRVPNNPLIIYVKNIGKCRLNPENIVLIIDGNALLPTDYIWYILEGGELWNTQLTLVIEVTDPEFTNLPTGDHYIKVSINGVTDTFTFKL